MCVFGPGAGRENARNLPPWAALVSRPGEGSGTIRRVPRLLAFIAHPDDEAYSFGGTIALAAKAGWECVVCCASSGEKGKRHDGGSTERAAVGEVRERELATSCDVLGARPPEFWRLPDGGLTAHSARRTAVNSVLRAFEPDLILTHGSDGAYGHPDHIALHEWVLDQWRALPPPRPALLFPVFPKGLFLPQYEKCIGMMGDPPEPPREAIGTDAWHYEVPIHSVREKKLGAIAAHRSQLPGGDPVAIFPPGIVTALLEVERFEDASGRVSPRVAEKLAELPA